jgi:C-methyltransferase C-terminal domain/Putative zinc binding domain
VTGGCFLCRSADLAPLLDVGAQPISNRFLRSADEPEERFPIALRQCAACGLVQIDTPVPARALIPPYEWITYNEPEGHLDDLVAVLMRLPGIGSGAVAAGVSFKDDSTLARLERRGLRTWRLDLRHDLEVADAGSGYGVETIQDRLTPAAARRIVQQRGPADVLLVRHILEHAGVPLEFIEALKILIRPGGYIVLEVPDCSRAMDGCDYTTIWEEHTLYFTPLTFCHSLSLAACNVVFTANYPYPFENSLVAIAQTNGAGAGLAAPALVRERERGLAFGRSFVGQREKIRRCLLQRRTRGRIVLFGAGHLACMYVNVFGVAGVIDAIVDDNPHKQGLFMPGSRLPIAGSSVLQNDGVSLCLLSLNPIGEEKVIEKNTAFVERGGTFASIFPASARALDF